MVSLVAGMLSVADVAQSVVVSVVAEGLDVVIVVLNLVGSML